jgi:hypothetical protein
VSLKIIIWGLRKAGKLFSRSANIQVLMATLNFGVSSAHKFILYFTYSTVDCVTQLITTSIKMHLVYIHIWTKYVKRVIMLLSTNGRLKLLFTLHRIAK